MVVEHNYLVRERIRYKDKILLTTIIVYNNGKTNKENSRALKYMIGT